jgi:hypothetical protein
MLNKFFDWLQHSWGANHTATGDSFSLALHSSLNFWGLLEGTHLLTLMLFFGTIMMVDLRMMGVAFKRTPFSVLSERILPLTVFAMVTLLVTGGLLFLAKPADYWHNLWFRAKMVILVLAFVNLAYFHKAVQKDQAQWDTAERPPSKVRLSAIISISSWVLIILCGRFIAYNWFECGKGQPDWVNIAQDCKGSELGAVSLKAAADAANAATEAAPSPGLPELPPAEGKPLPELPAAAPTAATPEAK